MALDSVFPNDDDPFGLLGKPRFRPTRRPRKLEENSATVSLISNTPDEDDIFAMDIKQPTQRNETMPSSLSILTETRQSGNNTVENIGERTTTSPSPARSLLVSQTRAEQPSAGSLSSRRSYSSLGETGATSPQSTHSTRLKPTNVAMNSDDIPSHGVICSVIDAEGLRSPVQQNVTEEEEEEEGREAMMLAEDQEQTYASEFSSSDEQGTPSTTSGRREGNGAGAANCEYTCSLSEEDEENEENEEEEKEEEEEEEEEEETQQPQHFVSSERTVLVSQERPGSWGSDGTGQKKKLDSPPVTGQTTFKPSTKETEGVDFEEMESKRAERTKEEEEEEEVVDGTGEHRRIEKDMDDKGPSPDVRSPPPPSRNEMTEVETLESALRPETDPRKSPYAQSQTLENSSNPILPQKRHSAARIGEATRGGVAMATGGVDQCIANEIVEEMSELTLTHSETTTKLPQIKPILSLGRVCQKRRTSPPLVSARRKFVQPVAAHRVVSARCPGSTSPEQPESSRSESHNLQSGTEVRELAYKIWYQRQARLLRTSRQKELEELKKEEAKIEEEVNRLQDSQRVFLMWKEKKEQQLSEERKKRKAAEAQKMEAEKKAEEHKEEAQKAFLAWRKSKEKELKKKTSSKPTDETVDEIAKKEEKTREAKAAYEAWQKQKDAEMKARLLAQKLQKQKEEERKREERAQRRQAARDSYTAWELRKAASIDNLKPDSAQFVLQRQAWRPPSARIPSFI